MGKKLKIARILADKTQNQLADEIGVSRDYISALETGRKDNPSLEVMKKLSKALNVPVMELFFSDEQ
ncbi:MAG: helix-turn-helix transcriptional regulator [Candidatus Onthovivens sp.]|nr:helix-turn-helix transcriptional regulator [Candidatus Onthovivens sp.]